MQKFNAIFKARTMEFVRDRGTFIWNLFFPIVLVFGFAFAFSGDGQAQFKVGIIGSAPASEADPFLQIDQIEFIEYNPNEIAPDAVIDRLRRHQLDMVLNYEEGSYYINEESPNGPLLRMLRNASGVPADATSIQPTGAPVLQERAVTGRAIRYVDWVVPGVIGMNMLFSCLFGVGFVIVRYRKNGVLKRLKASPVSAFTFVSAQAVSRMVIVVITSVVVYAGANAFLHFVMNGSYFTLLILTTLAILSMISVGLIFAGRMRSEELASGLMNIITFPMIILSGVFFSMEGSPAVLQKIARVFPLTHFVDGARAIMIEGAGIVDIAPHLLYLGALALVLLLISGALFRWE